MAYKMKGFGGFKSSPAKQYKKPTGPRAEVKPEKLRKKPMTNEEMNKDDFIRTRISEGSIETQALRRKENQKQSDRKQPTYEGTDEFRPVKDIPKKEFKAKGVKKSPAKQEGPIPKKNIKLQKGEMDGTYIYEGKDKSERIIDLEERAGFLTDNDITNDGSKEDNQRIKTAKKLQHEADILRNRKPANKKK